MSSLKPAIMMVFYQASMAGVNVFYKLASTNGMKVNILIAYRFAFAAAFIVPLALLVERKKRPKLTWKIISQAFLTGLLSGSVAQNLYTQSLVLTSATFVSAMINLVPSMTFILAIFFRMEKLGLRTRAGKAKLIGTLLSFSGAMLLTFYKGNEINLWSTHIDLLHKSRPSQISDVSKPHGDHVLGAILIVGCCFSCAAGFIVQAKMIKNYPCNYSSTALLIFMGAIQAIIFALCKERSNWAEWELKWDIRLLTVSYTGVFASGIMFIVLAWCMQMRGPLYVSAFNPLLLVLVAIAGSIFLEEKLHLGSILGAVIIVVGLYLVLWGKGEELRKASESVIPSKTSNDLEGFEVISAGNTKNNLLKSNTFTMVSSNGTAVMPIGGEISEDMKEEV